MILSKRLQILFPLDGKHIFLLAVAILACGNHVPSGRLPTPCQGHDVVHGKGFWRKHLPAVVAPALAHLTLPPLRFPQFPGLVSLPIHEGVVYIGNKLIQNVLPREKTDTVCLCPYHSLTKPTRHFKGKGGSSHLLFVLQMQATCSMFSKSS